MEHEEAMSLKGEESSAEVEGNENVLKGFKGVRRRKWGRWVSEVRVPKSRSRIWLGSYDSAETAARAHDAAVYCLRGEAACFNFPVDEIKPLLTDEQRLSLSMTEVKEIANMYAYSLTAGPSKAENEVGKEVTDVSMDSSTSPAVAGGAQWDYSFESLLSGDAVMIEEVVDMWDLL